MQRTRDTGALDHLRGLADAIGRVRSAAPRISLPRTFRCFRELSPSASAASRISRFRGRLPPGSAGRPIVTSGISHSGISHSGISRSGISDSGISHSDVSHSDVSHSDVSRSGISHPDISGFRDHPFRFRNTRMRPPPGAASLGPVHPDRAHRDRVPPGSYLPGQPFRVLAGVRDVHRVTASRRVHTSRGNVERCEPPTA